MTLVKVTICGDYRRLCAPPYRPSEAALARYARRILELLTKEFRADFTLILGSCLQVDSDDPALAARVHARVADIQATPEWVELAHGYAE